MTTTHALDTIVRYLDRGISVVPLAADDKRPAGRWRQWQRRAMDTNTAESWWSGRILPVPGVGIVTGAASGGLTVLDVEPEHVAFVRGAVKLPDTAAVTTARGGLHLYCRGRQRCGKLVVAGRHVGDIRSDGGYVVAPPSIIRSGTYRWEGPDDWRVDDLADVPHWVAPPPVVQARAPLPVPTRRDGHYVLPSYAQLYLDKPAAALLRYHSTSERDFGVMVELIYEGLDYEDIEELWETTPMGLESLEKRDGTDYLYRTYKAARRSVEEYVGRFSVLVRCLRVVWANSLPASRVGLQAQKRALVEVVIPRTPQTFAKPMPVILADGSVSGEWITFCRAFKHEATAAPIRPRGLGRALIKDGVIVRFLDRNVWG